MKEDTVKSLQQRLQTSESAPRESEFETMYRRENETLKQENRMLRDRITQLSADMEHLSRDKASGPVIEALESENRRLRADLQDKESESRRQMEQMRGSMQDRDSSTSKQKNEWAEIYGNMKREGDDLKRDIRLLN